MTCSTPSSNSSSNDSPSQVSASPRLSKLGDVPIEVPSPVSYRHNQLMTFLPSSDRSRRRITDRRHKRRLDDVEGLLPASHIDLDLIVVGDVEIGRASCREGV